MTENTMKMPSMQQAFAIARSSLNARNKARQDVQPTKDRESTFYETGNGNPKQLRFIKQLLDANDKNELRAQDEAALYQQALDHFREITKDKGHVGNLADMAERSSDNDGEDTPQETAAEAANRIFTEQNRVAAGEALDLDNLKSDAPAETSKPKGRGGRKKAAETQAEAAPPAPVDDEVPPAPSSDDFDEDIRPAFLRAREEERASEEQGGTFSRVH